MRKRRGFASLIPLAVANILTAMALVPQSPGKSNFVTTLGTDTIMVEQYARTKNSITGDLVTLTGALGVYHYVATLRPDGTIEHVAVDVKGADGHVRMHSDLAIGPDSAIGTVTRDTAPEPKTTRLAVAGAFPLVGNSIAFIETISMHVRAQHKDSTDIRLVTAVAPFATPPAALPLKFFGADSAALGPGTTVLVLAVDPNGRVRGLSGRRTTVRLEVRPVKSLDIAAIVKNVKERASASALSPRDTVNATAGNAHLWIDYGRPSTRGRDVFKDGVLGDTLWRTGANAATQFRTDVDLVIAGKTIPAGTYTLWTHVLPKNAAYELVFNKQVGQWGTQHDFAQDFVAVPLTVTKLSAPVSLFTLGVVSAPGGGTLRYQWAGLEFSTRFALRQ